MAGRMNQEYEDVLISGIEKYRYAMAYARAILSEHGAGIKDVIVLLASEDEAVNRDTLLFLRAYQAKKQTDHFIIISSDESAERAAKNYAKVPYSFVRCSKKDSDVLEWLYNLCRLEEHMIVNSFQLSGDHDAFLLADGKMVTKADIVARVVLSLEGVPSEEELLVAAPAPEIRRIPWLEAWKEVPHISTDIKELDKIVERALSPLIQEGKISLKDRIAFFGVTKMAQSAREQLKGYRIAAYLDNDPKKWGETVAGIPVLNPNEFQNRKEENVNLKILICSRRYQEIIAQLMELGYKRGQQVFVIYSERLGTDLTEASENYILENRILEGKRIYEEIRRNYPEECILVRPYAGTGDIFLLGGYIKHIMQRLGKEKGILIVPGNSEKKMAELFGMNALVYPAEEAWKLLAFVRMAGFDRLNVFSDNCNIDQGRIVGIEGYKNIDMHTLFQKMVFQRDTKIKQFDFYQENADPLFESYGLKKGRTVLLAPYSGTYKSFSMEQWKQLAVLLTEKGYSVCTNTAGTESMAVEGTVAVSIPYSRLTDFMSKAGFFIGIRSGLCDIVSVSSAVMIVLYPINLGVEEGFWYRFFSLEKMELRREKLLELEYDLGITKWQIAEIMEFIQKN